MSLQFGPASFRVVRGTNWTDNVTLTDKTTGFPVNLTGIIGLLMRIRDPNTGALLLELSMANSRLILVDAPNGVIGLRVLTADTYANFPANNQTKAIYPYDMVIQRTTLEYDPAIAGKIIVLPQVTRPLGP